MCSQKSRQSKEKLQEVACCGGKLLEDVEAVKEGRLMPTAIPLDRPWLERRGSRAELCLYGQRWCEGTSCACAQPELLPSTMGSGAETEESQDPPLGVQTSPLVVRRAVLL